MPGSFPEVWRNSVRLVDREHNWSCSHSCNRKTAFDKTGRNQRIWLFATLSFAIADLPEPFRIVFMLRAVDGLSVEETADVLEVPPQTVKTRLLRARRRLQVALAPSLQDALRSAFPFAGKDCEALTQRVLARLAR